MLLAAVIAACGPARETPPPTPSASHTAADALLDQAQKALAGASSYRVDGMIDPDLVLHVVVTRSGWAGTVKSHGVTWEQVSIGDTTWVRGAALWRAALPADRAAALGDAWVEVTDLDVAWRLPYHLTELEALIPQLVFTPKGGLVNKGETTFQGQRVFELVGAKDTYDVLSSGAPYPVRWLDADIVGKDGQPCGITLSAFNAPVSITPAPSTTTLTPAPSP